MKILHLCLLFGVLFSNVYAEEKGRFKYEYEGYNKTPYISGSKFRVHQKDRPQPPRAIPPRPVDSTGIIAAPSDAIILFDGSSMKI